MKTSVWKLFYDFEKEEEWLNTMAAKGWNLTGVNHTNYTFEDNDAPNYTYRIALLEHTRSHPDTISYIRFMEEAGAEHVASYWRWAYFRKNTSDGSGFQIYTDTTSQLQHYKRLIRLFMWVLVANTVAVLLQLPSIILIATGNGLAISYINVVMLFVLFYIYVLICRPLSRFTKVVKELKYQQEIFE